MKELMILPILFFGIITKAQQLDNSFNTSGETSLNYTPGIHFTQGIHQQNDGKLIIASNSGGYFPVGGSNYIGYSYFASRFNSNGTIETTYGTNGTTKINFPFNTFNGHSEMSDSVLQPDGKLLMIGYSF